MKKSNKKQKKPLPSIMRVVGILIIIVVGINTIYAQSIAKSGKKAVKKHTKVANTMQKIEVAEAIYEEPIQEENIEENIDEVNGTEQQVNSTYETRMTSYYPEEDTNCTGSGLCSWDFQVNDKGWYTYQRKLVVATATMYLLKEGFTLYEGVHTYRYYDEITLNIDGVDYQAIVLDSCGSSMKTDRIDLFVSGSWAIKDTQIIVKE